MRVVLSLTVTSMMIASNEAAQTLDKELVATFSGPEIDGAIVSELLWDGGTLIIQSAAMRADGSLSPRYFAAPGANMELRHLTAAPASVERYWKMKAGRVSPSGLGTIHLRSDAHSPPPTAVAEAVGGMANAAIFRPYLTHEFKLGRLVIHRNQGPEPPYDGEVWGWTMPAINRIAYVDGNGDLWIARADGRGAERVMRGPVTLPAWSEDGRLIAVAERKESGKRWDVSIVRIADKFRR
jgi:hypothetical protein